MNLSLPYLLRSFRISVPLAAVLLPVFAAAAAAQEIPPPQISNAMLGKPDTIWSGRVEGGERVVWSTRDITLSRDGAQIFSLELMTDRIFAREIESWFQQARGETECEFVRRASLLSVADRYLGFRFDDERHCTGMRHPSIEARYLTLDLRDSVRMIRLDEIFSADDVRKALLGDLLVKKALAESGIARFDGTLDELVAQLAKFTGSCQYMFPADLLTRFVLYDVAREKGIVRIGLPHGCESARGTLTDLTLRLPVPSTLAPLLRRAAGRKRGYLMSYGSKIGRNRVASIRHGGGIAPMRPTD